MKAVLSFFSAVISAACLSGCSVHPLPEDVTDNTVMIVTKIRCEARDAVMDALIAYLRRGTKREKSFAYVLREDPANISRIDEFDLTQQSLDYLSNYENGAIGYEFTLDISEKVSTGFGLLNVFSNGTRSFDIGAGLDRTNTNSRNFLISDGFNDLVALYGKLNREKKDYCNDVTPGNKVYPITGKIGLKELVETFVELNDEAEIDSASDDKIATFTDSIEFQTIYSGRVNPKIELKAITNGFGLQDASLSNGFTRTDNHKVVIAIRLPPKAVKPARVRREAGTVPNRDPRADGKAVSAQDGVILDLNRRRTIDIYQSLDVIRRAVE